MRRSSMVRNLLAESKALWLLAWPVLVGQLANIGMSVADVAMAGHASAQDLAGVSLGASTWNIFILTLMGVMMSISPMVAQYMGADTLHKVAGTVRQGLWKALVLGAICGVAMFSITPVFGYLSLEPKVQELAVQFTQITAWGLPAFTCYRVLYGYSASIGQTKPMMVTAGLALALNVGINWLLVFGNAGFPALGGIGCAWSTLICVWFNCIALGFWIHRSDAHQDTNPFGMFEWPHGPTLRALLRLGLPIGVTVFAEISAFSLISFLVAPFGSLQIAAHQIALNFISLLFMVPLSWGVAVLTRTGYALGAGNAQLAHFRAWTGVAVSLGFAVVMAVLMALLSTEIASLYTNDPALISLTAGLLLIAAVFQLSDSTQAVASSAVRAYKVTRRPMLVHLIAFWVVSLPLGYALGVAPPWLPRLPLQPDHAMGVTGFWIALGVGLMIAVLGLMALLWQVTNPTHAKN